MTQKTLFIGEIIFVLIVGTLLHFTYDFFGNNKFIALFSAVNESTWEHLKLVFFPFLFLAAGHLIISASSSSRDIFGKAIGSIAGCIAVIVLFYTYTGIIGRHFMVMDIIIFVIGVLVGFYINYRIVNNHKDSGKSYKLFGCLIFSITALLFFVFTFIPPQINLFLDPISKTFGIS